MRKYLVILLLIYALLVTLYSLSTPLFEAPDAYYHFAVIEYIARNGERPPTNEVDHQPWRQIAFHAPLYHIISAMLIRSIDTSDFLARYPRNPHAQIGEPSAEDNRNFVAHTGDPWRQTGLAVRIVRGFSMILGGATLISVYWLARGIFPERPTIALVAVAAALFNPQFLFMSGVVNNDNLVVTLSTAALALLVHTIRGGIKAQHAASRQFFLSVLLLLVLAAGASLAKASGLGVYVPIAAGMLWVFWRDRVPVVRMALFCLAGFAVFGLFAGWWYWDNWRLYGEPAAAVKVAEATGLRGSDLDVVGELRGLYYSFWAMFGWFNIPAPQVFYSYTVGLLVISCAGVLWDVRRMRTKAKNESYWVPTVQNGVTDFIFLPQLLLHCAASLRGGRSRAQRGGDEEMEWDCRSRYQDRQEGTWHAMSLQIMNDDQVIALILTLYTVVIIGSWWRFNTLVLAGQGRLWFPLLGVLSCVIGWGIESLSHYFEQVKPVKTDVIDHVSRGYNWRFAGRLLFPVIFILPLSVGAILFPFALIRPVYAAAKQIPVADWQPPGDAVAVPFREPWRDEACAVLWTRPVVWDGLSTTIEVDVAWEARCRVTGYWSVFVHFSDIEQETCQTGDTRHILSQRDTMPDGGNTPFPALKPGYVLEDTMQITVPEGIHRSRRWHLQMGMYDAGGTFIRAFVTPGTDTMLNADNTVFVGRCSAELVNLALVRP